MADMKSVLISTKNLHDMGPTVIHEVRLLGPSSQPGRNRLFTADGKMVRSAFNGPNNTVVIVDQDPSHDGGFEAFEEIGSRLVMNYDGLNYPLVYDLMVRA